MSRLGLSVVALALLACGGGAGVVPVNDPSSGESGGTESAAAYFKAKCKSSTDDCLADARAQCGGEFTVVHKESHAGGLLADALPGPVTWYTLTFRCGTTAQKEAALVEADALRDFVMPTCRADWEGRCGLMTDKLESGATIDAPALAIEAATSGERGGLLRRAARECDERPDGLTDVCLSAFRHSFVKLLHKRYPQAKDPRLDSWCDAHSAECVPSRPELLRVLEKDYLDAHDRAVFSAYKSSMKAVEDTARSDTAQSAEQRSRSDDEERVREVRAKMVQQAVESMSRAQQGQQNCTGDFDCKVGWRCRKEYGAYNGVCAP